MGFIFGLLIGALAAFLYAPKSGDLTREELKLRTDELRRRADELQRIALKMGDEAQAKGKELIDEAKRQWERSNAAGGGPAARS